MENGNYIDWYIYLIIAVAIFALIGAILLIALVLHNKKKAPKHFKIDKEFIDNLLSLFGGKDNINQVTVDNARLKISVNKLNSVDLEGLKALSTAGVFVTGNIVKVLFKYDSKQIKNALDKA